MYRGAAKTLRGIKNTLNKFRITVIITIMGVTLRCMPISSSIGEESTKLLGEICIGKSISCIEDTSRMQA
ncbi:MAG: hypothetical protein NVS4B12_23290 [Ktedonobacteraceae bacterium]